MRKLLVSVVAIFGASLGLAFLAFWLIGRELGWIDDLGQLTHQQGKLR